MVSVYDLFLHSPHETNKLMTTVKRLDAYILVRTVLQLSRGLLKPARSPTDRCSSFLDGTRRFYLARFSFEVN